MIASLDERWEDERCCDADEAWLVVACWLLPAAAKLRLFGLAMTHVCLAAKCGKCHCRLWSQDNFQMI